MPEEDNRSLNKIVQGLKKFFNTKFSSLEPTQVSRVVLTLLVVSALAVFLKTADFERLRSQYAQSQNPPLPPSELLSEGNIQVGDVLSENVPAPCYDFNGDGVVSEADARVVLNYVGSRVGDGRYNARYDLDRSGYINIQDVIIVTGQDGRKCSDIVPSPTPVMDPVPSDLKVNLDMGCSAPISAQMVIFSWKPPIGSVNWRLDVSDNNWQTSHSTNRFQISGDRVVIGWSTSSPMNDGFVPAFGTSYKWRVSSFVMTVSGTDFRTPACPTPTPIPPTPPPTPTPLPPIGCSGPLKIMSVNLMRSGYQQYVVTQVDNLQNCNGIPVWVAIDSGGLNWQKCQVFGAGCSTQHLLPKAGTYPVIAVADLDRDGKWYEPGEYDKRTLTVNNVIP